MKTLALLALSLAVALAMPAPPPGVVQSPDLVKEEQSPLVGDLVPAQGHVELEDPAPEPKLESKEQPEKSSPEVKVEQELKEEEKVQVNPQPKEEEPKEVPEVKVEKELKKEPEVKVEQEVKEEEKVKVDPQPKEEPEVKVEKELKEEPDVQVIEDSMAEKEEEENPEPNLIADPDFKVETEVMVDPDVQMEPEPEENPSYYVQLEPEMQMNFDQGVEERHIDMESRVIDEPIEELEPMDDDNMFGEEESDAELSDMEKYMRATFIHQEPDAEPLPDFVDENQEAVPYGANMDEGPALDVMGQPISTYDNYFPNEEAREEMERVDAGVQLDVEPEADEKTLARQGERNYLAIEGKGYHFFSQPKRAEEAEFFCQANFAGGHLASITNQRVHREVTAMIKRLSGERTRTWVGGLRYLETGRFIWLDGSRWDYADWLSGEPNHTSQKENCIELLGFRNGQFNDFTCWEPQTFLCSFPVA